MALIQVHLHVQGDREAVIDYLKSHEKLLDKDYKKLLNLGYSGLYEILRDLKDQGFIRQIKEKELIMFCKIFLKMLL